MTTVRMDNVAIVVEDLDAAIGFFDELGLDLEGRQFVEGAVADECTGLVGVRTEIAMMRTPDGSGRLELTAYDRPPASTTEPPHLPPNTIGLHRVMFEVDDIEERVERLARHGATLLGQVASYEDVYLLCYLRGPSGIVVALAESIG
ncbi:VOC family protein [Nocardioides jiangxiensis]|uniref:VOC family protein n=1 Tax=Nocardioides jiangxiensis TaxID=3064524 RepID=A0ABT9B3V4_9ACTN|nr:VOC family protein [Nocardioides sp. WY-20]MDO7869455.1 VOC family protein [Nocardioides sp. WY-20]